MDGVHRENNSAKRQIDVKKEVSAAAAEAGKKAQNTGKREESEERKIQAKVLLSINYDIYT